MMMIITPAVEPLLCLADAQTPRDPVKTSINPPGDYNGCDSYHDDNCDDNCDDDDCYDDQDDCYHYGCDHYDGNHIYLRHQLMLQE